MSHAFDTINREKIMDVLTLAGCETDDLRLACIPLAGTNITVCVKLCWSAWFDLPIISEGMPQEWESADDVDFADEECEPLDSLLQTTCTQLRVWNLLVNETEFTHIYLADTSETDQGAGTRGNETWHSRKSLGSMLCSSTDIMHVVCLVTCLSAPSGQCGCEGLSFHCKSNYKSTKLYACPPCCTIVAAGMHRRPS